LIAELWREMLLTENSVEINKIIMSMSLTEKLDATCQNGIINEYRFFDEAGKLGYSGIVIVTVTYVFMVKVLGATDELNRSRICNNMDLDKIMPPERASALAKKCFEEALANSYDKMNDKTIEVLFKRYGHFDLGADSIFIDLD
jgi:hypothetical protein